jgi:hypothetical protein
MLTLTLAPARGSENATRGFTGRATCRCGLVGLAGSGRASRPRTARQASWLQPCAWHFVRPLHPMTRISAPLCTTLIERGTHLVALTLALPLSLSLSLSLPLPLSLSAPRRLGRDARHSDGAGGQSLPFVSRWPSGVPGASTCVATEFPPGPVGEAGAPCSAWTPDLKCFPLPPLLPSPPWIFDS